MTKEYSKFPGYRWSPTGEAQVFQQESDVPEGYTDYHPDNAPAKAPEPVKAKEVKAADAPAEVVPMTRKEILAALIAGVIEHDPKAKVPVLYALLVDKLKAHLTEAEITFPENATGPELLALVPKSE